MNIPVNTIMWCAAVLPMLVFLICSTGFKLSGYKSAFLALLITIMISLTLYRANSYLILVESAKGLWSSMQVVLVIWPAILIFEVTNEAKATFAFKKLAEKLTSNQLLQILILGWVLPSFLQGITGFGVPVAVTAPLLITLGVSPVWSVVIPLVGAAWGGTFGTLAVAWQALVTQVNLLQNEALFTKTVVFTALLLWLWNLIGGFFICWAYGRWEGIKKGSLAVVMISAVHGGGQLLMGQFNTTLACFLPTCLAWAAVYVLGKTKVYSVAWTLDSSPIMQSDSVRSTIQEPHRNIGKALFPYIALTVMAVFCLLPPPVNRLLSSFRIEFSFPQTETGYMFVDPAVTSFSSLSLFTHAGLFLFLAALLGYINFRRSNWIAKGGRLGILSRTAKKAMPASLAIIFLMMSKIMTGAGLTVVLAKGIVDVLGSFFTFVSPFVGLLGAFITSSTMASNILFSQFQYTTSSMMHIDTAVLLGGQTTGASIGNALAPGNIVLGAATAQIPSREGEILKKILPLALAACFAVGAVLLLFLL